MYAIRSYYVLNLAEIDNSNDDSVFHHHSDGGTGEARIIPKPTKNVEVNETGNETQLGPEVRNSDQDRITSYNVCYTKLLRIISELTDALNTPVSAKIRLLGREEKTLEIARLIEKAGASALTVHGRTAAQMYRNNFV